jgi:plasmid stabilization system protein ParE
MKYRVYWTSESERTFSQNLEYLAAEWDSIVISKFLERTEEVIESIQRNPKLFQVYRSEDNIYRCVLHERIVLFYKIVDENRIDLLTFWNTYKNPKHLNL